jgi:hypothetical protein
MTKEKLDKAIDLQNKIKDFENIIKFYKAQNEKETLDANFYLYMNLGNSDFTKEIMLHILEQANIKLFELQNQFENL